MRIEVWVKDDNGICGVKVNANAASPCGQQVDEDIGPGLVKFIDAFLPERTRRITILSGMVSHRKTP